MYLKFLGVGAGFSVGLGNNNAMIYQSNPRHGYWLIDCGEQTRAKLVDMNLIDSLMGVFVTHIHGDHIGGLEMLGFYWYFAKKSRLQVVVPTEKIKFDLMAALTPSMSQIQDNDGNPKTVNVTEFFNIEVSSLTTVALYGPEAADVEPATLSFYPVPHVPEKDCHGLLIEGTRKHFYTSDIRCPACELEYFEELDINGNVFHDVQLWDGGKGGVHCYLKNLESLRANYPDIGIRLMHYNRPFNDDDLDYVKTINASFATTEMEYKL